ncbi:hypothetical protein JCM10207_007272 [Rhodosporidiobolus poonsookiae]
MATPRERITLDRLVTLLDSPLDSPLDYLALLKRRTTAIHARHLLDLAYHSQPSGAAASESTRSRPPQGSLADLDLRLSRAENELEQRLKSLPPDAPLSPSSSSRPLSALSTTSLPSSSLSSSSLPKPYPAYALPPLTAPPLPPFPLASTSTASSSTSTPTPPPAGSAPSSPHSRAASPLPSSARAASASASVVPSSSSSSSSAAASAAAAANPIARAETPADDRAALFGAAGGLRKRVAGAEGGMGQGAIPPYLRNKHKGKEKEREKEQESGASSATSATTAAAAAAAADLLPADSSAQSSDLLSRHHALQSSLLSDLSSLSGALKTSTLAFSDNLAKDKEVMERAQGKLEGNSGKMAEQQKRLGEVRGRTRGTTCWTVGVVVAVIIAWVAMFGLMRIS